MARTQGSFQSVYDAAREFMANMHGAPHDPVVRVCDGIWILESAMESAEDCSFEIGLNDFISYWYEDLNDLEWTPTQESIDEFVNA